MRFYILWTARSIYETRHDIHVRIFYEQEKYLIYVVLWQIGEPVLEKQVKFGLVASSKDITMVGQKEKWPFFGLENPSATRGLKPLYAYKAHVTVERD